MKSSVQNRMETAGARFVGVPHLYHGALEGWIELARVTYLRPERGRAGAIGRPRGHGAMARSSRRRGPYIALGIFVVLLVAAAGAVAVTLKTSKANLTADSTALAKVAMPVGGGTIQTVSVTNARTNQQIPAQVSGGQIWPSKLIG